MLPCFFFFSAVCAICGCQPTTDQPSRNVSSPYSPSGEKHAPKEVEASVQDLLAFENDGSVQSASGLEFIDVAEKSGISFSRYSDVVPGRFFLPEVMGGGVGWIDLDLDGQRDLYAVNGSPIWQESASTNAEHQSRIFRQHLSRFIDVTSAAEVGNGRYGQGCAVGDFDSDGFPDLYVTNFGRNLLLKNVGDGTFIDVTDEAVVAGNEWSTSAVWFDANSDGLNDLYVTNYVELNRDNHKVCQYQSGDGYCGPGAWNGIADRLYLNRGDGHFTEQLSNHWGASTAEAKGLAVAAVDFDGDRIPEVYVGNDMMPNFLFKRRTSADASSENGIYENVASSAGCAVSNEGMNEASMGVACADFDGNGLVDIFLTHYFESKNTLYRNLGQLLFEDASRQTRVAATSFDKLGFGTVAFDANLDGSADLLIANGHVLGPNHHPNEMTAQILINNGSGVFTDVSSNCGPYFSELCLGRGAAGADIDDDGRVDIAVSHLDRPLTLLQNLSKPSQHYIGIELLPLDRCHPVGAVVTVHSRHGSKSISVMAGGSYLSANDVRLVAVTGPQADPVSVSVLWPSGVTRDYHDLLPDRYWKLSEPGDAVCGTLRSGERQAGVVGHD